MGLYHSIIQSEFVRLQETENFKNAFATRSKTDNRKWAGLLSLIRGYARLNGRDKLLPKDVTAGVKMFSGSLETISGLLPTSSLLSGVDFDMLELHRQLLSEFDMGLGQGCTVNKKKAKDFAKKQSRTKQFYELLKIKLDNKTMLIEDLKDGNVLIKRDWEGSYE